MLLRRPKIKSAETKSKPQIAGSFSHVNVCVVDATEMTKKELKCLMGYKSMAIGKNDDGLKPVKKVGAVVFVVPVIQITRFYRF